VLEIVKRKADEASDVLCQSGFGVLGWGVGTARPLLHFQLSMLAPGAVQVNISSWWRRSRLTFAWMDDSVVD